MVVAEAAKRREPLPAMQANVDAAQAKYDEARNRTSGLQAELDKVLKELGDEAPSTAIKEHIKQLRSEIMSAERREESCEDDLHRYQRWLESQEKQVQYFESEAEEAKPRSTRTLPSEMRSSAIWKRRKRPMTTPQGIRRGKGRGR